MTTYKVWIEIEQYDTRKEHGITLPGALDFAATAEFRSLDEATRFADRLNASGNQIVLEYDTTYIPRKKKSLAQS